MKKASLNDIAKRLGVSKTVVSFVLNGKAAEFRISEELCRKVREVADELNYQPNHIARGLRTGKTKTIGLVIADISNPFFGKLGREIEQEASLHGYRVVFCNSDENAEKFAQQLNMLQQSLVDGYILAPPVHSQEQVQSLVNSGKPLVLIDRFFPEVDCSYIVVDNFDAAYRATNHLLALGRKRIANINLNYELKSMRDRTDGYRQALADAGLVADESLIKILPFSHDNADVREAILDLTSDVKSQKADAILFSSSKPGVEGIECITSLGLKIPDDIAVVSFDNIDAYKICVSPVTVVSQPLKEIGQKAVQFLLAEIDTPDEVLSQKLVLKTELIIRKSCGA